VIYPTQALAPPSALAPARPAAIGSFKRADLLAVSGDQR